MNKKITKKEFEKIEKEFLENLNIYFTEIIDAIKCLRVNKEDPFIRAQLCLAFIGADTFSRFDRIFEGTRKELNKENKERFVGWLDKYVFTENNKIYKKNKVKIKCDSAVVWRMRNSFLHFYSFPTEDKEGKKIAFSFKVPDEFNRKVKKNIKERGEKVVFIDVYYLVEAILEGFLVQLNKLVNMIENEPSKYLDAVLFAHPIVMKGNAKTIMLNKNEQKK
jgi:hypothetical protein